MRHFRLSPCLALLAAFSSACADTSPTTTDSADAETETERTRPDVGDDVADSGDAAVDGGATDADGGEGDSGSDADSADAGTNTDAADADATPPGDAADATDAAADTSDGALDGSGDIDDDAGLCGELYATAESATLPVDIIWVIDGSPSMDDSISNIEANLNAFAEQIGDSGLNYRVVIVGADREYCFDARCYNEICVPEPLSGAPGCPDTDSDVFRHVREGVHSSDSIDLAIDLYDEYADFLRRGANTHFVFVTDDDAGWGPGADEFAAFLRDATAPGFSRVRVHSIVDLVGSADGCGTFDECSCGEERGVEYIDLSERTGGLVQSICETDWTPIFDALEERVVEGTSIPCAYTIPDVGTTVAVDRVNVALLVDESTRSVVPNVDDAGACGDALGWYYDDPADPRTVVLCPAACEDVSGAVEIEFGCRTVKR